MTDHRLHKIGPVLTDLVQGEPIRIHDRELVPLVRIRSRVKRQASLRGDKVSGRGRGFVHMTPVGILEQREGRNHYHPIGDRTTRTILALFLTGLLVPLLLALLVRVLRGIREDNRDLGLLDNPSGRGYNEM